MRAEHRIFESEQIDVPPVKAPGLLVMVHRLPGDRGLSVTALNFGRTAVNEAVAIKDARDGARAVDLLADEPAGTIEGKRLVLKLAPLEGRVLLIK